MLSIAPSPVLRVQLSRSEVEGCLLDYRSQLLEWILYLRNLMLPKVCSEESSRLKSIMLVTVEVLEVKEREYPLEVLALY